MRQVDLQRRHGDRTAGHGVEIGARTAVLRTAGRVSVTPLQIDLSLHQQLPLVEEWLKR